MFKASLANCKNYGLKYDELYTLPGKGILESIEESSVVDRSIKYMFDKLMKTFPNDTARLFFLQSELLSDELKEYRTNEIIEINPNDFKQKYYLQIKTKLNQLKEQCEQTRL